MMHDYLKIDRSQFVRIAKGSDESCMLLFAHAKNTAGWVGYHTWLGGELGITEYTILHTCDRESYEKELLEKKLLEKKLLEKKLLEEKLSEKKLSEKKRSKEKQKKTPTPYIDLNPTSSSNESSDEPSNRCGPQPASRAFQQAGRKCYSFPSSFKKRKPQHIMPSSKRLAQGLSSPSLPVQSVSRSGIGPPHTPPRFSSPPVLPPTPSTPSNHNSVRFQFLMAPESLGAIPRSLDQNLSRSAFFDEAFAAFTIVGKASVQSQMAGVKVAIKPSGGRPIFVPWGNREIFDEMMDIVRERAAGRTGRLDVEVTCIPAGK